MHDWRHSSRDAPHPPACDERYPPRHAGWLRWLILGAAILVSSCQRAGVFDPQGPIASQEQLLLINSTAIMLVVVVPVILATLGFAWWYRASNARASRSTDEGYEGRTEFVTWSIPVLIVILLGGVIWIGSHQLDPRAPIPGKADPLRVDVVALDWKWLFIYPDQGIAAVNQLVVPVGNAGRVPSDLGDGDEFVLHPAARQPDLHDGRDDHPPQPARRQAGRISGLFGKFQRRRLCRDAVHRQGGAGRRFRRLGRRRCAAPGSALDDAAYAELAKPSEAVPPTTYRSVEPNLFEHIIDQTVSGSEKAGAGAAWCPPTQQAGG